MTTVADSLAEEITLELSRARIEHGQAVELRRGKDTPAARAFEAECWARIDSLLDMYLEAGAPEPPRCCPRRSGPRAAGPGSAHQPAALIRSGREPPRDQDPPISGLYGSRGLPR